MLSYKCIVSAVLVGFIVACTKLHAREQLYYYKIFTLSETSKTFSIKTFYSTFNEQFHKFLDGWPNSCFGSL